MISYHCSVILSLFINFYLFCNYLSRLYLSLFYFFFIFLFDMIFISFWFEFISFLFVLISFYFFFISFYFFLIWFLFLFDLSLSLFYLYWSLFIYDCLLGELCAHLFEFIWGRTIIREQNYFLCIPHVLLWGFINSPPFLMAPFAKHWNRQTHFLLK